MLTALQAQKRGATAIICKTLAHETFAYISLTYPEDRDEVERDVVLTEVGEVGDHFCGRLVMMFGGKMYWKKVFLEQDVFKVCAERRIRKC